ncbi:MAG: threonine/serine dehydratase [Marinicaulis sp.]|nr:threonine/serine dehydratase [Marinicaulis sp.]NNL87440.1 threonine/serine dehydratase [Marinicaulis sp.]
MQIPDREITAEGVRAAAKRINGLAVKTPLIENDVLNEIAGARVFLKAEVLQLGGAFKFRGAYNLVSKLLAEQRRDGILAWSSGNHAQGVARAAKMFEMPATIIMPADAPSIKADAVRKLGAKIVEYDRYTEDREDIAREILAKKSMALAPSFDHPDIIEGQGTLALETVLALMEQDVRLDAFIAPCGGGGLAAGCATILEDIAGSAKVFIAEPQNFSETWASIQSGERQYADVSQTTICDAIATPTPGSLTLPILERRVSAGAEVSEQEVCEAVAFASKHLKLTVEPGGAVALAGVLSGKYEITGQNVVVVLSGGNIDPALHAKIISENFA